MTDDQAVRLEAIAEQHEALFFLRVIRIIDQASVLVQKKRSALPRKRRRALSVRSSFAAIPGKFDIAHIIMLAISSGKVIGQMRIEPESDPTANVNLPLVHYRA
jgi:hypothetical protein